MKDKYSVDYSIPENEVSFLKRMIREYYQPEIEILNKCYCERTDCAGRIKNSAKFESVEEENERLKKELTEEKNAYIKMYNMYKEKDDIINKVIKYIKEHCIDDELYINLSNKEKGIIDVLSILEIYRK